MDFTIEDNEWIVDKNTDKLNYELFGGVEKSSKSKLRRCRKRKRVKATSQGNIPQKVSPLISSVKKGKKKNNSHSSESAINCVNKLQKTANSEVESGLPRENSYTDKKSRKEERRKFHKQSSKSSTADLVAKGRYDGKNKPLFTSNLCRSSSKDKSKKYTVDSSVEELRKKRTTNSAKNKICRNVSLGNTFSTSELSNPNFFPPFKIKKLKAILKSAQASHKINQNLQMKDRSKGTLILEKGKRKEYSDIVRERAKEKLKGAQFRFINEKLYRATGKESLRLFQMDSDAFEIYHEGFKAQVDKWPLNPVDVIIENISKMSKTLKIADFGCGSAKIAQAFPERNVYSFDFIGMNDYVTACDMANVPLAKDSIDIAVFCLALMGTNLNEYLCEAHRVLKMGGQLKIAEVISRMENADTFIKDLKRFGFTLVEKNITHKMFIFLDLKKTGKLDRTKLPVIELKPCLYKKR